MVPDTADGELSQATETKDKKFDLDKLVSDEFVQGRQTYITRINEFLDSSHNQV